MKFVRAVILCLMVVSVFTPCYALQPHEVLLVANQQSKVGIELACYYQQQRHVPAANFITVTMPSAEECSQKEYQQQLAEPLRRLLSRPEHKMIRAVLLFYGLPLRVTEIEAEGGTEQKTSVAAVDSELALVLNQTYPLAGWQPNPYFVGYKGKKSKLPFNRDQVLFVSRLDGPTPAIVRRMIDDSLYAEQHGLNGRAYFDARWPLSVEKKLSGYALYDASIHKAAEKTKKSKKLPVKLNQVEELFQPGEAPQAAIYCGWYSLGKYVDAFNWQRGAVGYHIASSECTTLKGERSQVWCKRLLEDGVAATIGPVAEPYVQGFPLPELFYHYLLDGYYTLAESYFLSLPFLSWQMVLIGDPLYRPFRNVGAGD